MLDDTPRDLFRIILLEPKESQNIGSVARAMMNLGFGELAVVAPREYDPSRAAMMARRATPIIEGALFVPTLEEAIASCTYVAGFSTKESHNTPPVFLLDDWVAELTSAGAATNAKIALLFGPEDTGLRYEHLPYCNAVVRIPSRDQYDSLNLAQAVMIVLYVLSSRYVAAPEPQSERAAIGEQYARLDMILDNLGHRSGFINVGTPPLTMGLLRHLFRRQQMTHREMQILLGLFARIEKKLSDAP